MDLRRASAITAITLALSGCGFLDANVSWAPQLIKSKAYTPPSDPPPDIHRLYATNPAGFFSPGAEAQDVRFASPRHMESGWETCIRASIASAIGKHRTINTYMMNVVADVIVRRELVDSEHWCFGETFRPI